MFEEAKNYYLYLCNVITFFVFPNLEAQHNSFPKHLGSSDYVLLYMCGSHRTHQFHRNLPNKCVVILNKILI